MKKPLVVLLEDNSRILFPVISGCGCRRCETVEAGAVTGED